MMLIISIHPMCLLVNYVETPFRLLMKKYLLLLKLLFLLLTAQLEEGPRTFMYDLPYVFKFLNAISISIALHLEHTHSIVKTKNAKKEEG